ncbi:MAG: hypothetical protein JW974_00555 [Alphaproteobacteria bacterium]|nr:hypothetical protein [Alphaproteobacteria bacterium]MBN2675239.1 hypothetical protein [Alphaproteobacteria bacterium]
MNDRRYNNLVKSGKIIDRRFSVENKEKVAAERVIADLDKLKKRAIALHMNDIVHIIEKAEKDFSSKTISKETVKTLRAVKTDVEFKISLQEIEKMKNNNEIQR